MQIYPAIDIKDGKCVRLKQGRFDEVTVFYDEPADVAKRWEAEGATYIHVVDLDGARYGNGYNIDVIKKIISNVSIPVQLGGGVRSLDDIEQKISMGVSRVILGTAAIKTPDLVKTAIEKYGEGIVIGIDASDGNVAIEGWEEVSSVSALDLALKMRALGAKSIIYTDIARDGMMKGVNLIATKKLIDLLDGTVDVIASGGISSIADVINVQRIGAQGVIIGKALYSGTISLSDTINSVGGKRVAY